MIKQKRIPTILGIFIVIVSLAATVFLFKNAKSLLSQASADSTPNDVKITNLSDTAFTVSWTTNSQAGGTISYGQTSSLGSIALDDRDQATNQTGSYQTHHVTLKYLKPNAKYYFKIVSGDSTYDNNGEAYLVTTAPEIDTSTSPIHPTYGTVVKADGSPANGAMVYITLPNSSPVSSLVKSSGTWLVTLNNIRTANLSSFVDLTNPGTIDIFVQGGQDGTSKVTTTIGNDNPVPQITLGSTYDFTRNIPNPTLLPSSSPKAKLGDLLKLTEATPSPSLNNPTTDSSIPSNLPAIKGTGIPGKTVSIKVESENPMSGTTKVDKNGNWSWTPPEGLAPGEHTVTMTTTDSTGKLVEIVRKFTVLASGTQVVEAATSSGNLGSPSPSPTAIPMVFTTPVSTASAPVSGNLDMTIVVFSLGIIFIGFGFLKLILI